MSFCVARRRAAAALRRAFASTSSAPPPGATMRALRLTDVEGADGKKVIALETGVPVPAPAAGEALVRVSHAALNHRDNWLTMGMYPRIQYGGTLGSDGAGEVVALGDGADDDAATAAWLGRRVIIDASLGWGDSLAAPATKGGVQILGMPSDGTLAEYVAVPVQNLHACPAHLTDAQAAALPLAGATAFRALTTKGGVRAGAGQSVLVTGVGGGVALFALQMGVALGARVTVTSSCAAKLARAAELGAAACLNYGEEGWEKRLREASGGGGFDAVVDGAGGAALNGYLKNMAPGGRLVSYGVTAGPCKNLALPLAFLNNVDIACTAMSSPMEFAAMVELVGSAALVPEVHAVHAPSDFDAAIGTMRDGAQFGKICVDMQQS